MYWQKLLFWRRSKVSKLILLEAIATMVGTIVGAGILGIPYVFAQAGFWTGSLVLLLVGLAMILMKLLYGEVTLRTCGTHQISGYTQIYLGKWAKHLITVVLVAAIYGSLLAYFIGEGEVIEALTGIPSFWASLAFFVIFAFFILIGIKLIKRIELVMSGFILVVVFIIYLMGFDHINPVRLNGFDWGKLFVPYGVLLFATSGIVAVPEVRLILKRQAQSMKKAIIYGCLIPPVLYFLFTALVITITGNQVSEVASVALGELLGWKMLLVANLFAFLTMATSFLTLGLALVGIYQYDYKLNKYTAWLLMGVVPLIIFLLGARDFVEVISLVGALGVGMAGILYVMTYFAARRKGKRKPEYAVPAWLGYIGGGIIILMFMGGAVYTLMGLIK